MNIREIPPVGAEDGSIQHLHHLYSDLSQFLGTHLQYPPLGWVQAEEGASSGASFCRYAYAVCKWTRNLCAQIQNAYQQKEIEK